MTDSHLSKFYDALEDSAIEARCAARVDADDPKAAFYDGLFGNAYENAGDIGASMTAILEFFEDYTDANPALADAEGEAPAQRDGETPDPDNDVEEHIEGTIIPTATNISDTVSPRNIIIGLPTTADNVQSSLSTAISTTSSVSAPAAFPPSSVTVSTVPAAPSTHSATSRDRKRARELSPDDDESEEPAPKRSASGPRKAPPQRDYAFYGEDQLMARFPNPEGPLTDLLNVPVAGSSDEQLGEQPGGKARGIQRDSAFYGEQELLTRFSEPTGDPPVSNSLDDGSCSSSTRGRGIQRDYAFHGEQELLARYGDPVQGATTLDSLKASDPSGSRTCRRKHARTGRPIQQHSPINNTSQSSSCDRSVKRPRPAQPLSPSLGQPLSAIVPSPFALGVRDSGSITSPFAAPNGQARSPKRTRDAEDEDEKEDRPLVKKQPRSPSPVADNSAMVFRSSTSFPRRSRRLESRRKSRGD